MKSRRLLDTGMKKTIVRYLGETDPLELVHGKQYEVISIEKNWFRIIDETGEDYLYPPELFEIEDVD